MVDCVLIGAPWKLLHFCRWLSFANNLRKVLNKNSNTFGGIFHGGQN